jgi:hypothetical protein
MDFLLNRWRRTAFARYFAGLDRLDQVTFWVVTGLAFAVAFSSSAIVLHP